MWFCSITSFLNVLIVHFSHWGCNLCQIVLASALRTSVLLHVCQVSTGDYWQLLSQPHIGITSVHKCSPGSESAQHFKIHYLHAMYLSGCQINNQLSNTGNCGAVCECPMLETGPWLWKRWVSVEKRGLDYFTRHIVTASNMGLFLKVTLSWFGSQFVSLTRPLFFFLLLDLWQPLIFIYKRRTEWRQGPVDKKMISGWDKIRQMGCSHIHRHCRPALSLMLLTVQGKDGCL